MEDWDTRALSAAQAAVDSAPFRDTISLTSADSPYTVLDTQNGFFFSLDTSSGPIVLNLLQISAVTLPFNQRFKKSAARRIKFSGLQRNLEIVKKNLKFD